MCSASDGSPLGTESDSLVRAHSVASLSKRGFTVKQLLKFYDAYQAKGIIKRGTKTEEIVSRIVIPETSAPPRCYMESDFMRSIGGGQEAARLCSHAWKSEFANTVLNIVQDATEWPSHQLKSPCVENNHSQYWNEGVLDAQRLLSAIEEKDLLKTYWLCIFAINEHLAICGDCWTCNKKHVWKDNEGKHLAADPCISCGARKRNPCKCGSSKVKESDPSYELDSFPDVVRKMEALVVSLDPDLNTLKRVWCVAEIGEARKCVPVFFRLALGLSEAALHKLREGERVMESVEKCEASSKEDRVRILNQIATHGGFQAFDEVTNCMIELHFGRTKLLDLQGAGAEAVKKLDQLEMDFTWNRSMTNLANLVGDGVGFRNFEALRSLEMNFHQCQSLTSLDGVDNALKRLGTLKSLTICLTWCTSLTDVDNLAEAVGLLTSLTSLKLKFGACKGLFSMEKLGEAIGQLRDLETLNMSFKACSGLASADALGTSLGQMKALKSLYLHFWNCKLTSVDELGKGLAKLHLTSLYLNFIKCNDLPWILRRRFKDQRTFLWALKLKFVVRNCSDLPWNLRRRFKDQKTFFKALKLKIVVSYESLALGAMISVPILVWRLCRKMFGRKVVCRCRSLRSSRSIFGF